MQRDYPYFYMEFEDFKNGVFENTSLMNQKIALDVEREYGLKDIFSLQNLGFHEEIKKVFLDDDNIFYILDNKSNVWTLDILNNDLKKMNEFYFEYVDYIEKIFILRNYICILNEMKLFIFSKHSYQLIRKMDIYQEIKDSLIDIKGMEDTLIFFSVDNINKNTDLILNCKFFNIDGNKFKKYRIPLDFHSDTFFEFYDELKIFMDKKLRIHIYDSLNKSITKVDLTKSELDKNFHEKFKIKPNENYIKDFVVDSEENIYFLGFNPIERSNEVLKLDKQKNENIGLGFYYEGIDNIFINDKNIIYGVNFNQKEILILKKRFKIKKGFLNSKVYGYYISPMLDSYNQGNIWHKIKLYSDIPDNTQIIVRYFSFESEEEYEKILSMDNEKLNETVFFRKIVNPRDSLFLDAKGRFLVFKIDFVGNDAFSPEIKAIKVFYKRDTFLKYLPSIYTENKEDDFIERFLSIFHTLFMDLEGKIDHVYEYFDPESVRAEFLPWLARMMQINLDYNWSDYQLKELIKQANYLNKRRGTKEAIKKVVELYLQDEVFVVENFQIEKELNNPKLKDLYEQLYTKNPYSFTLLIKYKKDLDDTKIKNLKNILEGEKPAHTQINLVILKPWIYLDSYSYLGLNSYLSKWNYLKLNNESILPYDMILKDDRNENKLDIIGRDY